jgi:hypothetical protein
MSAGASNYQSGTVSVNRFDSLLWRYLVFVHEDNWRRVVPDARVHFYSWVSCYTRITSVISSPTTATLEPHWYWFRIYFPIFFDVLSAVRLGNSITTLL